MTAILGISAFYHDSAAALIIDGEPIVCTPKDAFKCFMGTELDLLVVGNYILGKEQQDKSLTEDYKDKYELD